MKREPGDLPIRLHKQHHSLGATEVVMLTDTNSGSIGLPISGSQRLTAAFLAVGMGLALLFGTGFAQPNALHNAAHDVRHAAGYVCH